MGLSVSDKHINAYFGRQGIIVLKGHFVYETTALRVMSMFSESSCP